MLTRQRMLALVATAAAALALAACGGGDDGVESNEPAALAPADTLIYTQAVVRPKGPLKADVEEVAATISGEADVADRLTELIDEGLAESDTESGKELTYAKDIEPWLGENVGVFLEGIEDDPPAAAIAQTTDPDAAQQFIDDAKEADDKERSYEGVDYIVDEDTAVAVVEDFLVFGDLPAFKRAIDVSAGEDALSGESKFTSTLDEAPAGSLADLYVNLDALARVLRRNDPENAKAIEASIGKISGKTALASMVPTGDSVEFDLITNAGQNIELADVSSLVDTFPADSFAAFGVPDLGDRVGMAVDQLEKAGIEGFTREAIDQQLAIAGTNLDEITGALGDLGIFAGGTNLGSLQGAGVITSDDPATAEKLIKQVSALALRSGEAGIRPARQGTGITIRDPQELGPQALTVTVEGDRIVIGYGERATQQGLSGSGGSALADDATYTEAVGALGGDDLTGYVALQPVFRLAEALGASADPDYQQARQYLDALQYAVIGAGSQGEFSNTKIIVGVEK